MAITAKTLAQRGQRQAQERGLAPGRVPAGQYVTERFPVLTYGRNPKVDLASWPLSIDGAVDAPFAVRWDELLALEQVDVHTDIHCVTRWSKLDTTWTGVRVAPLLERAGLTADATHVMAHCDGGYTTQIEVDALFDDDVLLAHAYHGQPLEPDHGAPLRLLVPKRYFWKSAKFVRRLELMPENRQGFWELNGYHDHADPWAEERTWF